MEFFKMSGSGNDFIVMDNRAGLVGGNEGGALARRLCPRGISVGADGLILIENSPEADFAWRFFNADGSEAEMCGNGGRCAARFAFLKGIAKEDMSFVTKAGIIDARVRGREVKIRLTDPRNLTKPEEITVDGAPLLISSINTGVPHAVHFTGELASFDVVGIGRNIRHHERFKPAGTNANFAQVLGRHALMVRTYERGVEDETLACGTGAVASSLLAAAADLVAPPVSVRVKSGEVLQVYFERQGEGFSRVYLEGSARVVYEGLLWNEVQGEQTTS